MIPDEWAELFKKWTKSSMMKKKESYMSCCFFKQDTAGKAQAVFQVLKTVTNIWSLWCAFKFGSSWECQ
ncbi:hypothetical protein B9G55_15400 [Saccharibacillus sp. O16]|nr:hypothetical protein B9G55_15400 [Saccharibacillus sp. O16]